MKNYLRYLYALLAVGVIVGWRYAMVPLMGYDIPYITLFPVTVAVALWVGMGPSIVTGIVGTLIIDYAFIEPSYVVKMDVAFAARVTTVVLTSAFVGYVASALRAARATAEQRIQLLRESETKYRELVQNANSAIIRWKCDGAITFFNEYAQKVFGYSADEVIGKHVGILLPEKDSTGGDLTGLIRDIVARPANYINNVNENICRDGRRIWMTWTNRPIFDEQGQVAEILAVGADITEQKRAEEALIKSKNQLQSITDNTPALVYILDLNERFLLVNKSLADLLKSSPEKMIGKRRHEFMPKDDADRHEENDRMAIKAGTAIEFEEYSQLNGRSITWLTTKFPLRDPNGEIYALAGITADITERKRAEEALCENERHERARAMEFERLGGELAYKNEELESIIRIASHDLRSPLMNIKGFSSELSKDLDKVHQMLKELPLPEKVGDKVEMVFAKYVPEAVGFIQNSAEAINRMLKSLTLVAKAGTVPINIQELDMNAILADITANYQFRLIESCGTLAVEPLPPCRGDTDQIMQIFSNLIGNAIKYREPLRPLRIRVYAMVEKNAATYCVEDNGKGIAAEHHDKVFDLFTRLDPETAEGEGLGLTIAKRMVERLGGKIWITSEIGKGSTFFVMMPK